MKYRSERRVKDQDGWMSLKSVYVSVVGSYSEEGVEGVDMFQSKNIVSGLRHSQYHQGAETSSEVTMF